MDTLPYFDRTPEFLICPEFKCATLIADSVVRKVLGSEGDSDEVWEKYQRGRIQAFIDRGGYEG